MTFGTLGNDTLSANGDFDHVLGLGGDDVLTSVAHNNVLIGGGSGQDQIDHTISDPGNSNLQFIQMGNSGADTLTSDIDLGYLSSPVETFGFIDAGTGNDVISTDIASGRVDLAVIGDTGNDEITLKIEGDLGGEEADFDVSVFGGSGADTITATLTGISHTGYPAMDTNIDGGFGDDVISVEAFALSNSIDLVKTTVTGGGGNDQISAVTTTSSNIAGDPGFHDLSGGIGNDTISSSLSDAGRADIDGGSGHDEISSMISGYADHFSQAENVIKGGAGNDLVETMINVASGQGPGDGSYSVFNDIDGGTGSDTLSGTINISNLGTGTSVNNIRGGGGSDVIYGEVQGFGYNVLNGGAGHDMITSVGGTAVNSLIGGVGNDTLIGGSGQDNLDGGGGNDALVASGNGAAGHTEIWDAGTGSDVFVFNPFSQQDDVTINNWQRNVDILEFSGLSDSGPLGLADDLTASGATVTDGGFGGDVVLTLGTGTQITFVGEGTLGNTITSVDLIVDDALNQII